MRRRNPAEVPAPLCRLAQRFGAWRKTRSVGERIPESLWKAAATMAVKHGLNRTARALKLDYYALKKRVAGANRPAPSSTFVELPSPPLVAGECVIEWEDSSGARMRVQVKGQNLPDVLALSRSFWNAD